MKKLLWALLPLAALPVMASAQFDGDPSTKPAQQNTKKADDKAAMPMMQSMKGSPELKKLSWMAGNWRMTGNSSMGPNKMKVSGTSKAGMAVGDAWLVADEILSMGKGMPALHGHLMITYDAAGKQYMGYWIDDTSSMVTSMKGKFTDDNTIVFKADAANGMPATTYTMARTKSGQTFEMKAEDGSMAMTLNYTRAVKRKPVVKRKPKPAAKAPAATGTGTTGTTGAPGTTGTTGTTGGH